MQANDQKCTYCSVGIIFKYQDSCVVKCMIAISIVLFPFGLLIWTAKLCISRKECSYCDYKEARNFTIFYVVFFILCAIAAVGWITILILITRSSNIASLPDCDDTPYPCDHFGNVRYKCEWDDKEYCSDQCPNGDAMKSSGQYCRDNPSWCNKPLSRCNWEKTYCCRP